MSGQCPKCKAPLPNGVTCQDYFDRLQQLELQDPAYYAVHYLSVPCYLLQHNQYSREGWLEARKLLLKFILENWTPEQAREYLQKKTAGSRRGVSFTRSLRLLEVDRIAWSDNLSSIRADTAAHYCEDVRNWGRRILADTEPLIRQIERSE